MRRGRGGPELWECKIENSFPFSQQNILCFEEGPKQLQNGLLKLITLILLKLVSFSHDKKNGFVAC